MTIAAMTLVIVICMLGEAFFSGMETGMISIQRLRLRHLVDEGSRRARILQNFLDHSDRLLGTTLVGTNICVVIASVLAASVAAAFYPAWGKLISSVVMTAMLLVFCEYIPKAWFRSRPLERCIEFAHALRLSWIALRPLGAAVIWLTRCIVPRSSRGDRDGQPFVTRDDLKILTKELGEDGVISPRERTMIHRVFELSSRTAGQIMIPIDQMTLVHASTTVPELLQKTRGCGFTRLPVYSEQEKKFTGIVNIFDVLSSGAGPNGGCAADYMRTPQFISENMPVDDILPRMRSLRQPMCLVTNADSNAIGLVTTEDVLEEIVGQL